MNVHQSQLEAFRAAVARQIASHEHGSFITSRERIDHLTGDMLVQLDRYVYGVRCERQVVEYPADWRSHFNRDVVIPAMIRVTNATTHWGPWRRWLRKLIGRAWAYAIRRHWFDVTLARSEFEVRATYPEMKHIPHELGQPFMVATMNRLGPLTWSPTAPMPGEGPPCPKCGRELDPGGDWCEHCDGRDDVRDEQGHLRERCEGPDGTGHRCPKPVMHGQRYCMRCLAVGWR